MLFSPFSDPVYFNPRSGERSDLHEFKPGEIISNFNPRSGERSDGAPASGSPSVQNFNPRSGERSDVVIHCISPISPISIHAPANGATRTIIYTIAFGKFQSTLRRTERRSRPIKAQRYIAFQSTLRRTERPAGSDDSYYNLYISIHAPANGATFTMRDALVSKQFQSTLRRTERPADLASFYNISQISIHAPANGATIK